MQRLRQRLIAVENVIHRQLVLHSVSALRVALGLVFLGFGVLKFFPGISPAEDLTETTTGLLFLHLVPERAGLVGVATLECFIGLCLLAGKWMRLAIWLLAAEFVGILSPLVLLPGRLFAGPDGAPTLEGQYVLKDVILVAAGMVIAAATFRGGRLVRDEPQPTLDTLAAPQAVLQADQQLELVLQGSLDGESIPDLCGRCGVSEAQYFRWRDLALAGARRSLVEATDEPAPTRA